MPSNSRFDSRALLDNRQVRIFLSSTFSDMEAERSALLHTFDTLRVKARRRNVDLAVLACAGASPTRRPAAARSSPSA